MSFNKLISAWQKSPVVTTTDEAYAVNLPLDVAASLHALDELYPGVTLEEITTDLLATAATELVAAMPYEAGERVIREDEFGDPVYEDAGQTPQFEALKRAHLARLNKGS